MAWLLLFAWVMYGESHVDRAFIQARWWAGGEGIGVARQIVYQVRIDQSR